MKRDDQDLLDDLLTSPALMQTARSKRRTNRKKWVNMRELYYYVRSFSRSDMIALLSLIATVFGVILAINWRAIYSFLQPPVSMSSRGLASCSGSVAIPEYINPQDLPKSEVKFFTPTSSVDFRDTFFEIIGSQGTLWAVLANNEQNEMSVDGTIVLSVRQENMPSTINALSFGGGCGSGGPTRLLSYTGIPLSIEKSTVNRIIEAEKPEMELTYLKPGEQVDFMFRFDCIDYGRYFINIDVYYTILAQRTPKRIIENKAIVCPSAIKRWSQLPSNITNSDTHYSLKPFVYNTVTSGEVALFDQPGKDAYLLEIIRKGEDIAILETQLIVDGRTWTRIRYESRGIEGWVHN